MNTEEIKVNH
jgi:HPt (histidine-containing phosphotransfer) domain-containing protein